MNESNNICFICLNGHISLKAILQNGPQNETALQVRYVLPELTFFDNVYICTLCTTSLYSFYTFKKRCLENYNRLMHNTITQTQKLIDLQTKTLFNNEPEVKPEQVMDVDLTDELIIKDELLSPKAKEHQKRLEDLIVSEDNSEAEGFPQPEFVKCEIDSDGEDSSVSVSKNLSNKEVNENYGISENSDLPQQTECTGETKNAIEELLPQKSRATYDKEFKLFVNWKSENGVTDVNEAIMMAYFQELSEKYTPNSLLTKYSILKSTLIANDNIDISHYHSLVPYLKKRKKGYVPKKSRVLTGDQILTFMKDAPNEIYLMHKVVLIMGVFGGLRRDEMVKMTIDDIQDEESVVFVKVPESKTDTAKGFTIVEEEEIGALKLVKQYISLRPLTTPERRFFLSYRNRKCTGQPVGKNTIASVPTIVAKYLKLDNEKEYTGHSLRLTSSSLPWKMEEYSSCRGIHRRILGDSLKMRGKWKNIGEPSSSFNS